MHIKTNTTIERSEAYGTVDHTGVWSVGLESREIIVKHERAVILRIHLQYNRNI